MSSLSDTDYTQLDRTGQTGPGTSDVRQFCMPCNNLMFITNTVLQK